MANIQYTVCDRCGVQVEYRGWTTMLFNKTPKISKFRFLKLFSGNPSGYDYSEKYIELCNKCTKDLDSFLKNETKE